MLADTDTICRRAPANAEEGADWAELREARRRAVAETAHAGLAVTTDIGSPRFLHPTDKQDVGERLALLARNLIYRESVSA